MKTLLWSLGVVLGVLVVQVSFLPTLVPMERIASLVLVLVAWMVFTFGLQRVWWQVFGLALLVDIVVDQSVGAFLYYVLFLAITTELLHGQMSLERGAKRLFAATILVTVFQSFILVSEQMFSFGNLWSIFLSGLCFWIMIERVGHWWSRYQEQQKRITPKLQS